MKNLLFEALDNAELSVTKAQQVVQAVHNSASSYNYHVSVPYTHKYKVSIGKWKTSLVWKTETRYRDEIRFNHERFYQDLNNATAKLQTAQQQLTSAKTAIQSEISSMQSTITQANYLQSDISILKSTIAALQSKLHGSKYAVSSYATSTSVASMVSSANAHLSALANDKVQLNHNIATIPGKISALKGEINKNSQLVAQLTQQELEELNKEKAAHQKLTNKFTSYSEDAKAAFAFEAMLTGNAKVLSILEGLGFALETAAQVAVSKSQGEIFDYFLKAGAKFDISVNEKETLGLYIINSQKDEFIKKLIDCNQSLNVTIFMAAANNNFEALNLLLRYNANALKEFKDVKVSGLSIIQFAIANKNSELLEFVMAKDPECLKQEIKGYKSYFHMALIYDDANVLKALAKHCNVVQEIKQLIDSSESELLVKAIKAYELDHEQIESLLKYCNNKDDQFMAQSIISNCNLSEAQEIFDSFIIESRSDVQIIGLD